MASLSALFSRNLLFIAISLLILSCLPTVTANQNTQDSVKPVSDSDQQDQVKYSKQYDSQPQDRLPERYRDVTIGDDEVMFDENDGTTSLNVDVDAGESNLDIDASIQVAEESTEKEFVETATNDTSSSDDSRLPERLRGVSIGGDEEYEEDTKNEATLKPNSNIPFWISPDYVKLIQPDINLNDTNINNLLYDKDFTSKLLTHSDIPDDIKDFVKTQNSPAMEAIVPVQAKRNAYRHINGRSRAVTWQEMFGLAGNHSPYGITSSMSDDIEFLDSSIDGMERTPRKVKCYPKKLSANDTADPVVKILNSTQLMDLLGKKNDTVSNNCAIVLFFAPWCPFSAEVAPHYNALARSFKRLDVIAIDAVHFNKFGTVSVPNILVFHNSKAVARFNGTERTLDFIYAFVENVTAVEGNKSVTVLPQDYEGPLSSVATEETDYYLILSWVFIISFCISQAVRSNAVQRVTTLLWKIGNIEHQHID